MLYVKKYKGYNKTDGLRLLCSCVFVIFAKVNRIFGYDKTFTYYTFYSSNALWNNDDKGC